MCAVAVPILCSRSVALECSCPSRCVTLSHAASWAALLSNMPGCVLSNVPGCVCTLSLNRSDYYDISVAVSTPKGLVVPVLRDVDKMSFADVEKVRC